MQKSISKKTRWVQTSGWRGYQDFVNGVAGANDTGSWPDSPAPTKVRQAEIKLATSALRRARIQYRTAWGRTSNVFSNGQHILVSPEDRSRAIEILTPLRDQTRLLWVEKN